MNNSITVTVTCRRCEKLFSYEKGEGTRTVCDACKGGKLQTARERYNGRLKAERGDLCTARSVAIQEARDYSGVVVTAGFKVAKALGVTELQLMREEQAALSKLRKHPELLELWYAVRQEGVPPAEDESAAVLEYQEAVGQWWATHDELYRGGCEAEALECRALIEAFHAKLTEYLEKNRR